MKTITTPRLTIRRFRADDWQDLLELSRSHAESPFAFADYPWGTTEEWAKESAEYMATDGDMWAIEITDMAKVVCFVNFNGMNEEKVMDIGHVMNMAYGHHGYEEEGLAALYTYAFDELGAVAINAGWAKDDTDKLEPLYALGMRIVSEYEGEALDGSGRKYTGCVLTVTKDEFRKNREEKSTVTTKAPFRVLCDGMKGENYWIHGCAAYIADCLGLPEEYNYQFFNCYAGDSVEQIFSKDPRKDVWYMSSSIPNEGLSRVFRAMGRSYTRVTGINDGNIDVWLPKIRESIDKGLPVIARSDVEYNCIVGYSDGGLLVLFCDRDSLVTVEKREFTELVFVGERTSDPIPVGEAYREAVFRIPELLEKPETDELSFGIQAFIDWARQLTDGSLADYDNQWHNVWSVHGTYLCMLGSNGGGFGILEKARQYNPDMDWLDEVEPMYKELAEIFETLAYRVGGICGGFDMKPENVRDPEKMKPAAEKIMEAAELTKKISETIKKHKQI